MASRAFTADLLQASSAGLARVASLRLLGELTEPERYGVDPTTMWRDHIAAQINELALALASDQPSLFLDQVGWNKAAFSSRLVPEEDLYRSLSCLRDALREELPAEAGASAAGVVEQALQNWSDLEGAGPSRLETSNPLGELPREYLALLSEGERRRACALILDAVREGRLSSRDAILELCLPVEAELGRLWHLDKISIAQEHFITATTTRLMGQVADLDAHPDPHGKVVVSASLEADDHNVGLIGVSLLFELDGWETRLLGRNVPVEEVATAVEDFHADLVVISATLGVHVPAVIESVQNLRITEQKAGLKRVPVLVGGPAFRRGRTTWPGLEVDAIAYTAAEAVPLGRELLGLPALD